MKKEYIRYTRKKYVYHQKRLQPRNNSSKPIEKYLQENQDT